MRRRITGWAVTVFTILSLAAGGALAAVSPAGAATPACVAASATCSSYQTPIHGGLSIDSSFQRAVSNNLITVYTSSPAYVAEDFLTVPVATRTGDPTPAPAGSFYIEYAPSGAASGFCLSSIAPVVGTYIRLRPCNGTDTNVTSMTSGGASYDGWQLYTQRLAGDGFSQLLNTQTGLALNVQGYGGSGSHLINWTAFAANSAPANQLFESIRH